MPVNERGYEVPTLATDAVALRGPRVLLVRRGHDPGRGRWALPGGFVEVGETVEAACLRELAEETGLEAEIRRLVGVYSDPDRDPRGHVVSVPFLVDPTGPGEPAADDDAAEAAWFDATSCLRWPSTTTGSSTTPSAGPGRGVLDCRTCFE